MYLQCAELVEIRRSRSTDGTIGSIHSLSTPASILVLHFEMSGVGTSCSWLRSRSIGEYAHCQLHSWSRSAHFLSDDSSWPAKARGRKRQFAQLSDAANEAKDWAPRARKMVPQALRTNLNTLRRHDMFPRSSSL
jgi:hypothetical protein